MKKVFFKNKGKIREGAIVKKADSCNIIVLFVGRIAQFG